MKSSLSRPLSHDDALITSLCRYGESDCIVRLFTRETGRISAFYRRGLSVGPKASAIQALGFAKVGFLPGNDQQLARLVSADMDPRCFVLCSSLKLFAYCSYLSELIEKLLPEHEPASPVFDMLRDALEALMKQGAQASILRAYELKLLEYLGYLPQIPLKEQDCYYDPIACSFHDQIEGSGFLVSAHALTIAVDMLQAPIGTITQGSPGDLLMIARIFHSRLKLLGVLPLKSMSFFKQVSLK